MTQRTHSPDGAPRRVFVAGANGYIGRHVVRELCQRGHSVTAFVRPAKANGCARDPFFESADIQSGDVTDRRAVLDRGIADQEYDAIVSCIAARDGSRQAAQRVDYQANQHLLDGARRAGASQFILLSALCVQNPVLAFQQEKLKFEVALRASGLTWSIVRPSAFFKSLAGQIERVKQGRPFMLFGRSGDGPRCLPISEGDTARYLADCLDDAALQDRILPIGGPGPPLTPRERGEMLFELAGRAPRYKRIPIAVFDGLISLASAGSIVSSRLARTAEFARIGRFYATEPMLVRDTEGRYCASATPRYGQDTLISFYRQMWQRDTDGQKLGEQGLF